MKIKKIFSISFLFLLNVIAVSCSQSDSNGNQTELSLDIPRYTLGNKVGDTVRVAIVTEGKAAHDVRIPFHVSSKLGAVQHQDFELSDNAFMLHKGDSVAFLVVTRKTESKPKAFLLTLDAVEGVKIGALNYVEVRLLGKNTYSFTEEEAELGLSKTCEVKLQTALGEKFSFNKKTRLRVEVDPKSTAVEGVHFKFKENNNEVLFKPNKDKGSFTIEFLKYEIGKDHIVLRLAASNGFAEGQYPTLDIHIVGPVNVSGAWIFQGVSNDKWIKGSYDCDAKLLVDTVKTDRLLIEGTPTIGYNITPQFKGKLKNYFIAPVYAKFMGEREMALVEYEMGRPPMISLSEYQLAKANVAFDEAQSSIRPALIGMRLITNKKKEKILELSVYDYEPTVGNWKETLNTWKEIYGEAPFMLDIPLRLYFKKAK